MSHDHRYSVEDSTGQSVEEEEEEREQSNDITTEPTVAVSTSLCELRHVIIITVVTTAQQGDCHSRDVSGGGEKAGASISSVWWKRRDQQGRNAISEWCHITYISKYQRTYLIERSSLI